MAFLTIFLRFPTTFRRFPKILQNLSEGGIKVAKTSTTLLGGQMGNTKLLGREKKQILDSPTTTNWFLVGYTLYWNEFKENQNYSRSMTASSKIKSEKKSLRKWRIELNGEMLKTVQSSPCCHYPSSKNNWSKNCLRRISESHKRMQKLERVFVSWSGLLRRSLWPFTRIQDSQSCPDSRYWKGLPASRSLTYR